jgi:hypothetical protein
VSTGAKTGLAKTEDDHGPAIPRKTPCRSPTGLHTTHYPTSVKVFYPWHPLYGQEVKVRQIKQYLGQACYLIQMPDGSHVHMPAWMADEEYCRQFTRQESPVVSLDALRELARLCKAIAP